MIRVQTQDFNVPEEYHLISQDNSDGAVVTFVGKVRDFNDGSAVTDLTLEHYPGMTEKALENIESQASTKWDLLGTSIIHRVGELKANEQIVFVGVASRHRKDAFLAAQYIMDFLKNEAPFWKKQRTEKGGNWIESKQSDIDAAKPVSYTHLTLPTILLV